MTPQLVVLAGPNGAGKSTFYDVFLADSPLPFLNADLFAAETGVDSLEAARILDATRDRMIEDGLGFITETVFSDPHGAKLDMLRKAVAAGYDMTLIYIGVASAELSARRVDQRIARGGHDVPRDRIASWFERSLDNLAKAIEFVTLANVIAAVVPSLFVSRLRSDLARAQERELLQAWQFRRLAAELMHASPR
jgi:predicted ABC-type ATPase